MIIRDASPKIRKPRKTKKQNRKKNLKNQGCKGALQDLVILIRDLDSNLLFEINSSLRVRARPE